jgi:hypothetical protein
MTYHRLDDMRVLSGLLGFGDEPAPPRMEIDSG